MSDLLGGHFLLPKEHVMSDADVCWMACRAAFNLGLFLQLGSNVTRNDLLQLNSDYLSSERHFIPYCLVASPCDNVSDGLLDFEMLWFAGAEYNKKLRNTLDSVAKLFEVLLRDDIVLEIVLFVSDGYDDKPPIYHSDPSGLPEQFFSAVQALSASTPFIVSVRKSSRL